MSNRSKFVKILAQDFEVSAKDADALLVQFTDALRVHLLAEKEAVLPGFGRLIIKERPARKGHNPKTAAPIDIPARTVVGFKGFPTVLEVPVEVVSAAVAQTVAIEPAAVAA
jgi:DNA-binding protein HU-beta